MPLLLLSTLSYGLSVHPAAVPTPRAPAASTPSGRRDVLAGAGAAAAFAMLGLPSGAQASYAMYQASQDSYLDRKATNFVPVATNDKATLKGIQSDIAARKPQYRAVKAKKKPAQCCAMSKTSWLSLRPAGAPEASLSARSRPRLRPAPASLGQPAAQAALSGPTRALFSTQVLRGADRGRAADAREHLRGVRPLEGRPVQHRNGRVRWPPQVHNRGGRVSAARAARARAARAAARGPGPSWPGTSWPGLSCCAVLHRTRPRQATWPSATSRQAPSLQGTAPMARAKPQGRKVSRKAEQRARLSQLPYMPRGRRCTCTCTCTCACTCTLYVHAHALHTLASRDS